MNFEHLASFMRIAEAGSISAAADRMRIAQPALSRQMRLLEQEVGVSLFARHRRGMVLTEAGEELRDGLAGPLRQLDQVIENVRTLSHEIGGKIAFGMPPTTSGVLAGRLAARVARKAPNVSLRVVEGYGAHLVDWLQRGEIDAAILYGPASDYQLRASELLIEEIRLVASPGQMPNSETPVSLAELAGLPLILPSHPHGLRILAENAATRAGIEFDVRYQADSFTLMKELVETGLGYALLPLSAIAREVQAGRLSHAPLTAPRVTRQLVLATQPAFQDSRAVRTLARLVHEEIAELVVSGDWAARLMFDPAEYMPDDPAR